MLNDIYPSDYKVKKLLVCGGRDYSNYYYLSFILNKFTNIKLLVNGKCHGADLLSSKWAKKHNVNLIEVPANWSKDGRAAGPIRNRVMFDTYKPELVIGFGGNAGTKDMLKYAASKYCKVYHLDVDNKITTFRGPYYFLSNFYPIDIVIGDIVYPSLEHAYQAMKTKQKSIRQDIADCSTAGMAKKAGRSIPSKWLRKDWDKVKLLVMEKLLSLKFKTGSDISQHLIHTGDTPIMEYNNWNDTFWGCNAQNGVGHNHLGLLLMKRRTQLHSKSI